MKSNLQIIRRVTWVGAATNIILAALKLTVGVIATSQALIADGFHSLSDLISDGAVLIGSHFWEADYDEKHPYGHRRIETVISFFIALLLAGVACGIGWDAITTMQEKHSTHPGGVAFFAALISIISKELLFRWTIIKSRQAESPALLANAWHHRSDALSSLPVALAVATAYFMPDFDYLDHIAAIIVSVMLLKAAWDIARPALNEILDAQGDIKLTQALREIQHAESAIIDFHKIRSRSYGSSIFVDLHMIVDAQMSVADSHTMTKDVEHLLKKHNPRIIDVTIHVEPSEDVNL